MPYSEVGDKVFDIQLITFKVISYPQKSAAPSGAALSRTGTIPLYNAKTPSFRTNSLNASLTPLGYFPSGAVQIRLVNTSAGSPTNHQTVPAIPPAISTGRDPTSSRDVPAGRSALVRYSYERK